MEGQGGEEVDSMPFLQSKVLTEDGDWVIEGKMEICGNPSCCHNRGPISCSSFSRSEVLRFLSIYNFQLLSHSILCYSLLEFVPLQSLFRLIKFSLLSNFCLQPIRNTLSALLMELALFFLAPSHPSCFLQYLSKIIPSQHPLVFE